MKPIEQVNNLNDLLEHSLELSEEQIKDLLKKLSPSEIAHALESSPPKQRKLLFSLLETNEEGDVLADLGEEIQQELVSSISNEELAEAVKELEPDETVDILQNLPEDRMNTILSKMSYRDRKRIVNQDDREVATIFERRDLISSAVIDESGRLIGRITIDDVLDVIKDDADQNFLGMAGVAEDTFAPPGRAARSRVFWLSMNLLTAFIASMTINIFKDVLDQIVYLAILMPIVASMGGVAATQTLTIVLRGLTLEQINSSNLKWLLKRELAVSILNGFILSILVGITTYLWFGEITLSLLISFALIINLVSSVIAGVFVPIILRSLNQDPAISGSVVVTTVTDVIGFLSFLGLATIFLI